MVTDNKIPDGYKQTEIGVIPEDWGVRKINDVSPLQRGFDLPSKDLIEGDYPVVYSNGVVNQHTRFKSIGPGVVTGRSGTLGKVHFIEQDYWPHNTSLWVTDFKSNFPKFIYYLLIHIKLERFGTGSGVPTLNRNDVHAFKVMVPPLPEQTAIANVLSDVDSLITSLDKVIAKKKDIKQGAMQELLTGKKRLPGFSGEWEVKRLGDISDIDPDNLKSDTSPDYGFKYISIEDVNRGTLRGFTECSFSSAPSRARRKLKTSDILFGTVRPNLKSHLFFVCDSDDFVCSTGFSVIRVNTHECNSCYVYYHLFGNYLEKQIDSIIAGSNYPSVSGKDVRSLLIPVPSLPEQQAIAQILSDMDTEINQLEQKRDKYKDLKQAMMQQLLTGKIRLV